MASGQRGTFAACWLDTESNLRLKDYFSSSISEFKADGNFHLTTVYTDVELPQLNSRLVNIRLDHATFGYDMFGPKGDLLVIKVNSPEIEALHEEGLRMGASWDFPVFNTHLTLTGAFSGDLSRLPPPPPFDLFVDRYVVEPLPRIKGRVPTLEEVTQECAS